MIRLGDQVQNRADGFEGVVVARHEYLNRETRLTIQKITPKGETGPGEVKTLGESQLMMIKRFVFSIPGMPPCLTTRDRQ